MAKVQKAAKENPVNLSLIFRKTYAKTLVEKYPTLPKTIFYFA